jgi:hypothetical protein
LKHTTKQKQYKAQGRVIGSGVHQPIETINQPAAAATSFLFPQSRQFQCQMHHALLGFISDGPVAVAANTVELVE